ncbi:DUF4258 domain-containing protein [Flavihumibacter fluvii]|uniref:DUF4258 domain-containing protein n=1 Tax=Flavihumibacter fluvii TaxID=2838157 RepID=UPI001BDF1E0A|nr:DUF4258 domain-containing protein [Flavihumibacter fluvii]ULQ53806.1 DUF4258 domain-containing protein [Flavihumibacter fluvii]
MLISGILVLLLVLVLQKNNRQSSDNKYFNRDIHNLAFSRHARCRMNCRQVSEADVLDILKNGTINPQKTRLDDQPCPSFALEGYSSLDKQHLRIIFAQCEDQTKVVTCIDLDKEFYCNCK